jgi:hypothetical protein
MTKRAKQKTRTLGVTSDGDAQVVWLRVDRPDYVELRNRQIATGATVAAQIRIFIREGLHRKKRILK